MKAFETQVGGDHYKKLAIQPVELWVRWDLGACEAAILKYVMRARMKNGLADIDKAIHFVDLLEESVAKTYNDPYGYLTRVSPCMPEFAITPKEVIHANGYSRKEAAVIYAIYDFSDQRRRSPRGFSPLADTLRTALHELRDAMVSENARNRVQELKSQDCCGNCGKGGVCERDLA